jgi:hypothetical protein
LVDGKDVPTPGPAPAPADFGGAGTLQNQDSFSYIEAHVKYWSEIALEEEAQAVIIKLFQQLDIKGEGHIHHTSFKNPQEELQGPFFPILQNADKAGDGDGNVDINELIYGIREFVKESPCSKEEFKTYLVEDELVTYDGALICFYILFLTHVLQA